MDTSNHSEKGTSRRTSRIYNITPAGSRLARYLEYLASHPDFDDLGVERDWTLDSSVPPDPPAPIAPPERYDDEREQAGTPSPKWGDYSDDNRQSDDSFDDDDPEENYNSGYSSDDPGARGDLDRASYSDDDSWAIDPASDVDDGED